MKFAGLALAGVILAPWQSAGALRTATLTQHNLSLNIGFAVNGSLQLYFSTYDGLHTWARFQSGFGWSGELRPSSINSSTYRSDYDIYNTIDSLYYGYGSVTIALPASDADGDGLPDFLDRSRNGGFSFSGTSTEYVIGEGTRDYLLSGSMSRSAGNRTGSYSVYSSSGANAFGNFAINGSSGSVAYDPDTRVANLSVTTFDGRETVTGQTSYTILSENQIRLETFTAHSSLGGAGSINGFVLTRSGNRYAGKTTTADGNISTSWVDYDYYHVRITDTNDADGDGIPDLSDLSVIQPPTIASHPAGTVIAGGGGFSLSVAAGGGAPLDYAWSQNGAVLGNNSRTSGATSATLVVANARRADNGNYRVRVSNGAGAVNSSIASVRVLVPSRCEHPVRAANGLFSFAFRDQDGGVMKSSHAPAFTVQYSADLILWRDLPLQLTVLDGKLQALDATGTVENRRFYRIIERP